MKYSLWAFLSLAFLFSCQKTERVSEVKEQNGVIYISLERTKNLFDGMDSQLSIVDIFVFDKNGLVRAREKVLGSATKPVPVSVPVGNGTYNVYAIANSTKSSLDDVATEEDLLNTSSLLSDNEAEEETYIEMMGKLDNVKFVSGETYPIALKHTLSKIRLNEILIDLPAGYNGWRVNIKDVYLVNANIKTDYSLKWDNPVFVNKTKKDKSGAAVSTLLEYGGVGELENGESSQLEDCNLYCYPNATTVDSSSPTWCPRFTRLVVEVAFEKMRYSYEEGVIVSEEVSASYPYYYPINIIGTDGKMAPNTSYNISSLTITGPGSDSPDVPIVKGSVSVSMTIDDWSEGFKQTVVY